MESMAFAFASAKGKVRPRVEKNRHRHACTARNANSVTPWVIAVCLDEVPRIRSQKS
jgi:hypothetical protein